MEGEKQEGDKQKGAGNEGELENCLLEREGDWQKRDCRRELSQGKEEGLRNMERLEYELTKGNQ